MYVISHESLKLDTAVNFRRNLVIRNCLANKKYQKIIMQLESFSL